ncbi:MAG: phycobilisome protein [Oscillatoria sp. SIO1A7]|nr:phycobilisome protein [Oscillatoria sp. SIO1A7]
MQAINSQLEELIGKSEGRYMTDRELQPLKQYVKTLPERSKTYLLLQEKSDLLVRHSLKKLMSVHPDAVKKHAKRCYYDMSLLVRYLALAMLRDDRRFFNEVIVLWQANVLTAYRQQKACLDAYGHLQETFKEHLPTSANRLIEPYMDMILQPLDLQPKLMATVERA